MDYTEGQFYDTLLSEQFSAHFGVCCVVTRSILQPTDAITTANPQDMYEMLFFCQRLHISGSVKWPLSYKHNLLDRELFPWEYPVNYHHSHNTYFIVLLYCIVKLIVFNTVLSMYEINDIYI